MKKSILKDFVKGINGLTAEPKEKYYELRGWKV